ncbi:antA/AntB antirepressor family protein [Raineya sp.]
MQKVPKFPTVATNEQGSQVVSARDLYDFLGVKTDFTDWCKRMFDYGFEQGQDFSPILRKSTLGRPSIDYALTLDTAKEISMLQRSEKGRQVRRYFIECEKRLRSGMLQLPNYLLNRLGAELTLFYLVLKSVTPDAKGWRAISSVSIKEYTGLSEGKQKRCRRELKKLGVLVEKRKCVMVEGVMRNLLHYYLFEINAEVLEGYKPLAKRIENIKGKEV